MRHSPVFVRVVESLKPRCHSYGIGALNLITDDVRVAAAHTIKTGHAVSLSRDIGPRNADTLGSGLALVQRFMGLHEAGDHLEGKSVRFDAVTEYVGISAHGSSTHIDGLAHYSWDGKNYNGFPESDTTSGHGARSLSVHHAERGFVTRGVLLDIAALHGVRWLDRGYGVRRKSSRRPRSRRASGCVPVTRS